MTTAESLDGKSIGELIAALVRRGFVCTTELTPTMRVARVEMDSRRVRGGELFVAVQGARVHGVDFARDAVAAGAVAVVCQSENDGALAGVPTIFVDDVMRATGHLASLLLDEPSRRLALVGVTGTNGKTSCTYLLESVWREAGIPAGISGTIVQRAPGFERSARLTTPDAIELQRLLDEFRAAGARWAALEVSSHALAQHRVAGCEFRAAVFTNLTRDHLDYHGSEQEYFEAKLRLFTEYLDPGRGVAVINADDPRADQIRGRVRAGVVVLYSGAGRSHADVRVEHVVSSLGGVRGTIVGFGERIEFSSRLFGEANLANVAAVAAVALATGVDPEAIGAGVSRCAAVPGRLERIGSGDPAIFVDYAHTPDALQRTLTALRRVAPSRVIVVFGCGGDRDRGKRPLMGGIGARLADVVVLTSDNPRSEEPSAIIAEIEAGIATLMARRDFAELSRPGVRGYAVEPDREAAIRGAVALARPTDVVLVAGKGHEDYQEIAGVRRPFDDRALASRLVSRP